MKRLLIGAALAALVAGPALAYPGDATTPLNVNCTIGCSAAAPATQVYSGQLTLAASAAALSTGTWSPSSPTALVNGIVCKAPTTNTGTVYIGPSGVSSANGYSLKPGEAISYGPMSVANLYALDAVTTDVLVCTGS